MPDNNDPFNDEFWEFKKIMHNEDIYDREHCGWIKNTNHGHNSKKSNDYSNTNIAPGLIAGLVAAIAIVILFIFLTKL